MKRVRVLGLGLVTLAGISLASCSNGGKMSIYGYNADGEVKQSLKRWLNTREKNAFAETYKLLKPLSQSEQLAFGGYYYI